MDWVAGPLIILIVLLLLGLLWFLRWHKRDMTKRLNQLVWPLVDATLSQRDANQD